MVVRVRYGKNIRGALSYNEQKIISRKADLIAAGRFGCDTSVLSFSQKLKRFTLLIDKCVTSEYSSVHISLNFSNDDKLDNDRLQLIARDYLQGIGFDKQPYLVYRHYDANHTHIHIVTTPVRQSGRLINLHNLVKQKSEPTRKQLEDDYGLVKAQSKSKTLGKIDLPLPKAVYGKVPTKQAISAIVGHVMDNYRFSDFEQFNCVLRQFNVLADQGEPGTRMTLNKGLQYFIMDSSGKKIGVPIKASAIYSNPGLLALNNKYQRNSLKKQSVVWFTRLAVINAIKRSHTIKDLNTLLESKNIAVSFDGQASPLIIDHRNKTAFSLAELQITPEVINSLYRSSSIQLTIDPTLVQRIFADEYAGQQVDSGFYKKKRKKKR